MNNINVETIVIVALIAVGVAFAVVAIKKRNDIHNFFESVDIKNRIKQLIILAEHEIVGTKKGQERLFYVCSYIWQYIPPSIKPFVTVELMVNTINVIFKEIAVHMDDGTTKAVQS